MTADYQPPKCIKCGAGQGHDGRGWMHIETYQTDGGKGPEISLCAKCILESEAVQDLKNSGYLNKINLMEHPEWDKELDRNGLLFAMLVKIHQLVDKWNGINNFRK